MKECDCTKEGRCQTGATEGSPEANSPTHGSRHRDLLQEIDNDEKTVKNELKPQKKDSTLTRMLRSMRKDKEVSDIDPDKISMSKIFQRMNPVSKNSRESFSKVFHRIGDALQKKTEDERSNSPSRAGKKKTLERNLMSREKNDETKPGDRKFGKIGERLFKYRSSDTDPDKTA
ncbi:hypothetical protein J6590_046762 [Homalodisca vitripennis]|nr:hypothetical protein J6590_046762 [Homalodisca vitripennis]